MHALGLGDGANSKRKHRGTAAPKRGGEPDGADVKMARQQHRRGHDDAREHGPQEEALEGDGHGGHVKLGHEPEHELQAHGHGDEDEEGELHADLGDHQAQDHAPHGDAQPEPDGRHAGIERVRVADAQHELDDPAAEGNFGADVAEEKEGAQPDDTRVRHDEQSRACALAANAFSVNCFPVLLRRLWPKRPGEGGAFYGCQSQLERYRC